MNTTLQNPHSSRFLRCTPRPTPRPSPGRASSRTPNTVVVYERPDKNLSVWLRWSSIDPARKGKRDRMTVGIKLRETITGKRDTALQEEAVAVATMPKLRDGVHADWREHEALRGLLAAPGAARETG